MRPWYVFITFLFFVAAGTMWWANGPMAGVIVLAMTIASTINIVRIERASKRDELESRREIEAMGFTWEFYQEWCAYEDEIEEREVRRAIKRWIVGPLRSILQRCHLTAI